MKQTASVLFIGNSYTYFNDMPLSIFAPLAASAGLELEVEAITKGGYTLTRYADPADEYGEKVAAALSGKKHYDFVILQEQSLTPADERASLFEQAVRDLAARIRKIGAKPVLYATWGRKTGSKHLAERGWTNESMTQMLAAAYGKIGTELDIPVAHVGQAFYDVYTHHEEIELYNEDRSHPSYGGSYLAAATLFGKIFGVDPTSVAYNGELPAEQAGILRKAAKKAISL